MAGVAEFERWAGLDVHWALEYLPSASWNEIEDPRWFAHSWAPSPYKPVYSIPLIPDTGGNLAAGAAGAYDGHFVRLAQTLVAEGQAGAVLRLGWEFNGPWYRWSARSDPAAFAAYWRRIVTAMRGVPGAAFKFDWCPVLGSDLNLEAAYPGDAFVDYVGMDVYDQDWYPGWQDPVQRWQNLLSQPYGLRWHRDFAAEHGKPMTFPEWGLISRPDGHGGGDDPYFVQRMHEWINANNVAYALYFDFDTPDGLSRLTTGNFPRAAETFRVLFGGGSGSAAASAPDDLPAPSPSSGQLNAPPSTPVPSPDVTERARIARGSFRRRAFLEGWLVRRKSRPTRSLANRNRRVRPARVRPGGTGRSACRSTTSTTASGRSPRRAGLHARSIGHTRRRCKARLRPGRQQPSG